jgi:hypothetical protein
MDNIVRLKAVSRKAAVAAALSCSVLLLAVAVGCGGGTQGTEAAGELSMDEMWAKAQEADSGIESWHMEIASYYENTQYGSGQIQSIIIDVNGEDIHEQDLLLGQVYFEYKRVGDKQYNKDMENGTWTEVPAEQDATSASEYTSQFLELPSMAASQEHLGTETLDEEEAEHFHFTLSSDGVKEMFSSQPSFDFSQNTGGDVDVWIDSDEFYLIRYELVIRNAIIPEKIGNGDIRFVVSIRDINEPIEITPPT